MTRGRRPDGPILIELVAVFGGAQFPALQSVAGRFGAEGHDAGKVAMKMILLDDERVMRVGVSFPSVGHEDDGAEVGGASPESGEQVTLNADVLDPLVVGDDVVVIGGAPSDNGVDDFGIVFDRGDFLVQRDAQSETGLRVEVDFLGLAIEVARLHLPVLAFAFVGRKLECAAAGEMEGVVNVEDGLHPVVASGDVVEAFGGIAEG